MLPPHYNIALSRSAGYKTTRSLHRVYVLTSVVLLSTFGCSKSGIERVYVSGLATYCEEPINVGQIRFVPLAPTTGPITVELIRDGKYETATSGGVPIGTHKVELRMYDPDEYRTAPKTPGSPAVKQLLPDEYNRESQLTITIDSGSDSVARDFHLPR